jgi:SAM-dependent methyltransferase
MTRSPSDFFAVVIDEGYGRKAGRLRFLFNSVFRGVPLEGARMLEIGGGAGVLSLWAAHQGARRVVCLEPEDAGSTAGVKEKFRRMRDRLGLGDEVSLVPKRVQDYDPGNEKFDVILLYNSVNHLDETACVNLLEAERHKNAYREIFQKIASCAAPGARLIVTDCSRDNFFARLGRKNPFAPDIEWHKHQAPWTWARLLAESGFRNPEVSWSSYNIFRSLGRLVLGNRLAAYFLLSHFRLVMTKG